MTVKDFMEVYDDGWLAIFNGDDEMIFASYVKNWWDDPRYPDLISKQVCAILAYRVGDTTHPIASNGDTYDIDPEDTIFILYING